MTTLRRLQPWPLNLEFEAFGSAESNNGMSVPQDGENWFVLRRGKQSGPHTLAALVRAVEKGDVGPEAGIWCRA